MAVADELVQVASGAIKDLMGPNIVIVASFLCDPAVILNDPAFEPGRIQERIDAAIDQLIDGRGKRLGRERRCELTKVRGVPPIIVDEDLRLTGRTLTIGGSRAGGGLCRDHRWGGGAKGL